MVARQTPRQVFSTLDEVAERLAQKDFVNQSDRSLLVLVVLLYEVNTGIPVTGSFVTEK